VHSAPLAAIPLLILACCASIPGFENPKTRAAVWALVYELEGSTSMQSGGIPVDNPPMTLGRFGIGNGDTGFGMRLSRGDGFSGLELDYTVIDDDTIAGGTLTQDWGDLMAGDTVNTQFRMYDLRLRWMLGQTWIDESEEWGVGLGLGAIFGHRELTMDVVEVNGLRGQSLEMKDDGAIYLAIRSRISHSGVTLTADYAFSDGMNFGGDFEGTQEDLQIALSYTPENQRMELFAGFQYSGFPGEGRQGNLKYRNDFSLEGYFLGLSMTF